MPGARPGEALTAEILDFLKDRLAKYKTPKSIDYVSEMPRDPNGKLYKRRLRDRYGDDVIARLAKEYGGTDGYKYVNGVLDKLAAKLRQAGVRGS